MPSKMRDADAMQRATMRALDACVTAARRAKMSRHGDDSPCRRRDAAARYVARCRLMLRDVADPATRLMPPAAKTMPPAHTR